MDEFFDTVWLIVKYLLAGIVAVAIVVGIAFLIVSWLRDKPVPVDETMTIWSDSSTAPDGKSYKYVKVTPVKEYCGAWNENEVNAEKLYKGKLVSLLGTVKSVGKTGWIWITPYVVLDADGHNMICEFNENYTKQSVALSDLNAGQKVVIVGYGADSTKIENCFVVHNR